MRSATCACDGRDETVAERLDPVDLELFHHRLAAVSEEMGAVLRQAGFSPNIKERRDFSCAVFDAAGSMVTHAAHIPVHLGSTPLSVRAAIAAVKMHAGDVVVLNDPYAGGTHLPDVTLVAPVYVAGHARPFAYVADRAHHADIGGATPGSMALSRDVHQEGFRIPPVHLCRGGEMVRETRELFLANTRVTEERLGDLDAQIAALHTGIGRIEDMAARFSPATLRAAMAGLQRYSARLMADVIRRFPAGRWRGEDHLDDDGLGTGDIRIRATIERRGARLRVDFAGSAPQVDGPLNANIAITTSAVFYVMACVAGRDVPANSGLMSAVEIHAPGGSIVNCRFPAAVAGGNVETSQRIVDVLLRALAHALPGRIPAASCGTMTNVALGGYDSHRARWFSYYETVGGGAGAGPLRAGAHALQTHMTNTLNTPVEALEAYYPLKVARYAIRRGSGGKGLHDGGNGIVREIEVLDAVDLTLLAERRRSGPYGLRGGEPGAPGRDRIVRAGQGRRLEAKANVRLRAGDRVRIETPGGGGWGKPRRRPRSTEP
jgi:N-methylhydantoinase B